MVGMAGREGVGKKLKSFVARVGFPGAASRVTPANLYPAPWIWNSHPLGKHWGAMLQEQKVCPVSALCSFLSLPFGYVCVCAHACTCVRKCVLERVHQHCVSCGVQVENRIQPPASPSAAPPCLFEVGSH